VQAAQGRPNPIEDTHMIDLRNEAKLSLAQAAKFVPPTRQDKQVHVSTIVRWILHGVRGVRLEAVRVGGRWVTTHEALERFSAALTARYAAPLGVTSDVAQRGRASKSHQERVEQQLTAMGL
jgi:hypothetical protein